MVMCIRCAMEREGLTGPPFGGELGQKVHQQVCKPCWSEWIARQTMIINEYRLNVVDPQAQESLLREMRSFLQMP